MCLQLFCPFAGLPCPGTPSRLFSCFSVMVPLGIPDDGKTESEDHISSHSPPSSFFYVHSVNVALVKGHIASQDFYMPTPDPNRFQGLPKAPIKAWTSPCLRPSIPETLPESATHSQVETAETSIHTRWFKWIAVKLWRVKNAKICKLYILLLMTSFSKRWLQCVVCTKNYVMPIV